VNDDIHRLLESRAGIASRRELASIGAHSRLLDRAVRAGTLVRVSHGLYADAGTWVRLPEWERYRRRVEALLRSRPRWVASHHAALVLHGLPVHGADLARVDVAAPALASAIRSGVHVHRLTDTHAELVRATPRALPPAHACVLTAAAQGMESGVVAMDAALHRGLLSTVDLEAALGHPGARYGGARARAAMDATDAACESPGESLTRLALAAVGAEVRSQVEIHDRDGFVGRVDFLVGDRVVVEFDGAQKYEGVDGREALVREKRREDRLREAGYRVIRVTWSDLGNPARLVVRVRGALAFPAA